MNKEINEQKTFAGLRVNAAGALINLSFFLPGLGFLFPIVSLIFERENNFVKNYAKQTLFITLIILFSSLFFTIRFIGPYIFYTLLLAGCIFQSITTIAAFLEKEIIIPYIKKVFDLFFLD